MESFWSFRFFHMAVKVKTEIPSEETENPKKKEYAVKYVRRYEFKTNDARSTSAAIHTIAFTLLTLMCSLVIFA